MIPSFKDRISDLVNLDFKRYWLEIDQDFVHPKERIEGESVTSGSIEKTLAKIQSALNNQLLLEDSSTVENLLTLNMRLYSHFIKPISDPSRSELTKNFIQLQLSIIQGAIKQLKEKNQSTEEFLEELEETMQYTEARKSVCSVRNSLLQRKKQLKLQIQSSDLSHSNINLALSYSPKGAYLITKEDDQLLLSYRTGKGIEKLNLLWGPISGNFSHESLKGVSNNIQDLINQLQLNETISPTLSMTPIALMPRSSPKDIFIFLSRYLPSLPNRQEMAQGIYEKIKEMATNPQQYCRTNCLIDRVLCNSHLLFFDPRCSQKEVKLPFQCRIEMTSEKSIILQVKSQEGGKESMNIDLGMDDSLFGELELYQEMMDKGGKFASPLRKPSLRMSEEKKNPFNSQQYNSTLAAVLNTSFIPLENDQQMSLYIDGLLGILDDAAQSLQCMHEEGYLYQSLSPDHILIKVNRKGKVYGFLNYFDFAFSIGDLRYRFLHPIANLYKLGQILGQIYTPYNTKKGLILDNIAVALFNQTFFADPKPELASWAENVTVHTLKDVRAAILPFFNEDNSHPKVSNLHAQLMVAEAIHHFIEKIASAYEEMQQFFKSDNEIHQLFQKNDDKSRNSILKRINSQCPNCSASYFLEQLAIVKNNCQKNLRLPFFDSSESSGMTSEQRGVKRKREPGSNGNMTGFIGAREQTRGCEKKAARLIFHNL